jgi:tRNA modification GTPase
MTTRPFDESPIAALSSGSGPGAVGVIRVSGVGTWDIVSKSLKPHTTLSPRKASLRSFVNPETSEIIDDLVVIFFPGPNSYTGQDTIELFCHGGPWIIQNILSTLYRLGARAAEPGEFTKRALLNGKIDLTAAEGIKDLVEAQSRQQWLAGRQLYSGKLRDLMDDLRKELIGAMAYLEAMIDFPDEGDTQHVGLDHVRSRIRLVEQKLRALISTFQSGQVASRGLTVALAGAPNVGKSTLFNELLGKKRAIVSATAGTTRDYIEESCLIDGRLIRLVDTAGIRATTDEIEEEGVRLSREIIESADVILALTAVNAGDNEKSELAALLSPYKAKTLAVTTKSDLAAAKNLPPETLMISCETGEGLTSLRHSLSALVDKFTGYLREDEPFLTSARQKSALIAALDALTRFNAADAQGAGPEMLAFELQDAARSLYSVVGEIGSEDILDKIFSEFCIGK